MDTDCDSDDSSVVRQLALASSVTEQLTEENLDHQSEVDSEQEEQADPEEMTDSEVDEMRNQFTMKACGVTKEQILAGPEHHVCITKKTSNECSPKEHQRMIHMLEQAENPVTHRQLSKEDAHFASELKSKGFFLENIDGKNVLCKRKSRAMGQTGIAKEVVSCDKVFDHMHRVHVMLGHQTSATWSELSRLHSNIQQRVCKLHTSLCSTCLIAGRKMPKHKGAIKAVISRCFRNHVDGRPDRISGL